MRSMRPYDAASVMRYRAAVGHVTQSAATLADAAASGLQDGTPWSGLLSLHLRADGVTPDSWRDPSLAQVFGLRGAVYLVRRTDLGVFTIGALPMDEVGQESLRTKASMVTSLLADGPLSQSDVLRALPQIDGARELRRISNAGGFVPVWDTTDTVLHAMDVPDIDHTLARRELTLRFFGFLGPASVEDLAWWLSVTKTEAMARIGEIEDLLVEVETTRGPLIIPELGSDRLGTAPDLPDVVLLPPEDPLITRPTTRPWLAPPVATLVWPKAPPPGVLLLGGQVAGTWRRQRNKLTVSMFTDTPSGQRAEIACLATQLPLPYDEVPRVLFVDR